MKLNRYSLIVIVIIALTVFLSQIVQAVAYEGKFEYEIKSGTVVITNYIGNSDRLAIPYKIEEVKYAKIVSEAFVGSGLKKIVILNNVKKIEKNAFDRDVTIYGKIDSEAQRYANENNMPFRIYCDINGDENVTPTDILQVKKHIVELKGSELNEEGQERADLNCDGKVTTTDLLKLKLVAVGLDEQNEVVNPVNPDNPDEPELPKEPENEPELPEKPEFPDEPEPTVTPEPTVAPEEYVTVKYVTDPSLYPENSELASIKKQFNRLEGTMWKDISQKEYTVRKGESYNSSKEVPTLFLKKKTVTVHWVPEPNDELCANPPYDTQTFTEDVTSPGEGYNFKGWIYKDGKRIQRWNKARRKYNTLCQL